MKYSELVKFDPIEEIIQLTDANNSDKAINLIKTYVMSKSMADQLKNNMLSQLKLEDAIDNKGIFLVGNYGTGKSHLMSLISAIALDKSNLTYLQNIEFAKDAEIISGRFEVLRIELGAVTTPLREIILSKIKQDFQARDLTYDYPEMDVAASNKETLRDMMNIFAAKYPDKGYLIVVDEFLDFLKSKDSMAVRLDLGFMRELGEMVKESGLRIIFGVQEQLFDNPGFSFVWELINKIRERYNQVLITKEDTAYVVSMRLLRKNEEQKALVRDHLQKFCNMYSNMSERIEEFVSLYPIHPAFIDVFNKVYITEKRSILAHISKIITGILDNEVDPNSPGVVSFNSYWDFIRNNIAFRTNPNIKDVIEKSEQLEAIVTRSLQKKLYIPLALQMIHALSVHRLTTGDVHIRAGLTSENLRDELCLFIKDLPDQSSDTLQTLIQAVLKDVMTTVSGQFIDYNKDNDQYFLDLNKDIDYDEKITQRATTVTEDNLNEYFFDIVYSCLEWDVRAKVPGFRIYDHTLNWFSHNIYRCGYLFFGMPNNRSTAQPPEDYYVYFLPPYGKRDCNIEKNSDEVFFDFKGDDDFTNNLRLYAASQIQRELAEEKNKSAYKNKADGFYKKLANYLSENKNNCFTTIYCGAEKKLIDVLKGNYRSDYPFKETMDLAASILLDGYFNEKYPGFPVFKTKITMNNQAEAAKAALTRFAGRKETLGNAMLDSFGLLSGDNISLKNSKYAGYYASRLDKLPAGSVLNFNDIYDDTPSPFAPHLDKEFKLSYVLLPIVLLGLVDAGRAVITLKNGTVLSASNLDEVSKTIYSTDINEFKHISKPKDLQLAELMHLFEILKLPVGLIKDPNSREDGLVKLIKETQETVNKAVRAESKLISDFTLWGEPLIASHIASQYRQAAKRIAEMLGNFGSKYNTVAKLNNFAYSMEDIDNIANDIKTISIVSEYDKFKAECEKSIGYLMNIEPLEIGKTLKEKINDARDEFRKIRDNIGIDNIYGEAAAREINTVLSNVKNAYIDIYYEEHKKRRLTATQYKQKAAIMDSSKLANLRRLSAVDDVLSSSKLQAIETDLASLKVCYELTPELLKTSPFCATCGFQLGGNDPLAHGKVEEIEQRVDKLIDEWTVSLYNAITDPLASNQKEFLSPEQRKVIDGFEKNKTLPDTVDQFFVDAVKDLLRDYETVTVNSTDLIDKLTALGACDTDAFKAKVDEIIAEISKGKDKSKLRIIIR